MSQGIRIEFDGGDRVFRTGEPIAGAVVVEVDDGSRCEYVVLRASWRTHGKGTVAKGRHGALTLHEGPIPAGVTRFPFRFEAPDGPFTYRGHLLNVDHYLEARIEIPWGLDPSVEEDFVLVPGAVPAPPPDPDEAVGPALEPRPDPRLPAVIGAFLTFIGVLTFPFPGVLLLLAGAGLLYVGMRQKAAASRVGDVVVIVEPRVVAPGGEVRVAVGLFPPKEVTVNAVTAMLRGAEVSVSGSGSDRKTHRHVAHRDERPLFGGGTLPGGMERVLETTFIVPSLGMWTFSAERNRVLWDVKVSVDIPSWPDWTSTTPIVVWPARSAVEAAPARPRIAPPEPAAPPPPSPPPKKKKGVATVAPKPETPPEVAPEVVPEVVPGVAPRAKAAPKPKAGPTPPPRPAPAPSAPPPPVPAPGSDGSFADAVREVLDAGVVSGDRRAKAAALVGRSVSCDVRIDQVQRPFGRAVAKDYEGGRTLRGTLDDSGLPVEVRIPAADADAVDALKRGDTWPTRGTLVEWARLPDRPVIAAEALGR